MNELPPRPTALAQMLLAGFLKEGGFAIDATAGNGHDTAFLADRVGRSGKVLAFDVQDAAIVSARDRVEAEGNGGRVEFFCESHLGLGNHAPADSVDAVMFNLGYLPGADHAVATGADTLAALAAAAAVLKPGGALSVVCYPGHEGGGDEAADVERWFAERPDEGWRIVRYGAVGTRKPAPFLLLGVKPQAPAQSALSEPFPRPA